MSSQGATVFTIPAMNDFMFSKILLYLSCPVCLSSLFPISCRSFVGYNYKFGSSFVGDYSSVDFLLVRLIKEIRDRLILCQALIGSL